MNLCTSNHDTPRVRAIVMSCPHSPHPLQAFSVVFQNAIDRAETSTEVKQRVLNLIDSITYLVFMYTTRGLFERDKLIFTSQVTFQVRKTDKCWRCWNVQWSFLKSDTGKRNCKYMSPSDFIVLTYLLIPTSLCLCRRNCKENGLNIF